MSHGSPWTFLGHNRLGAIVKKYDAKLNILPVNYGDIFPVSGGLPVTKRPPQRQKIRLQELERWSKFLKIKLIPQPKFFPSKSQLPSLVIIASKLKDTKKDFIFNERLLLIGEDGAKWGPGEKTSFIIEGKSWVNNHVCIWSPT